MAVPQKCLTTWKRNWPFVQIGGSKDLIGAFFGILFSIRFIMGLRTLLIKMEREKKRVLLSMVRSLVSGLAGTIKAI